MTNSCVSFPRTPPFAWSFRISRTHWATLRQSPFAEQFRVSPLGKTLAASAEVEKLNSLEKVLEKRLGLNWTQVRDDLFGESIVFAYRPGPPEKPDQEQGLILVRPETRPP